MGGILAKLGIYLGAVTMGLFKGWKVWIMLSALVAVGIIIYNTISKLLGETLTWVVEKTGGIDAPGAVISSFDVGALSSVGAWMCTIMKIPECFAFMITCILAKWTLRKIPLIRW